MQDADTGQAIVHKVIRAWLKAPADAPARDVLPDLVVVWGDCSTAESNCIVSDRLPGFAVHVPKHNVSGRSGNHVGRGWFVVHGVGLASYISSDFNTIESADYGNIRDLAPTLFKTIGARPLSQFEGKDSLWQMESTDDH
jgi:hypothetical protein